MKKKQTKNEKLETIDVEALRGVGGGFNRNDVDWRTVGRMGCSLAGGC